jgi:hypothetical protein
MHRYEEKLNFLRQEIIEAIDTEIKSYPPGWAVALHQAIVMQDGARIEAIRQQQVFTVWEEHSGVESLQSLALITLIQLIDQLESFPQMQQYPNWPRDTAQLLREDQAVPIIEITADDFQRAGYDINRLTDGQIHQIINQLKEDIMGEFFADHVAESARRILQIEPFFKQSPIIICLESEINGVEEFTYSDQPEADAAFIRLLQQAKFEKQHDGITRKVYYKI